MSTAPMVNRKTQPKKTGWFGGVSDPENSVLMDLDEVVVYGIE